MNDQWMIWGMEFGHLTGLAVVVRLIAAQIKFVFFR